MGTTSRRLTASLLVAGLLVLGACGGGGDDDADATTTTAPSSTTAGEGSSSTTEGAGSTEATASTDDPDGTTTTVEGGAATTAPDTRQQPDEGAGAPDEEAPDVDWARDAAAYRGQDGRRIAFLCPPDGDLSASVWGTDTYTDDSAVCVAAVHQGIINPVEGGRVVIEIAPGEDGYTGSEANDVTSQDYGNWGGSFTFPAS